MFGALVLWLGGGALYLWLMTLIFFRYTFLPMSAEELTPPYWINMGAVAISTLAGATLLDQAALSPIVGDLAPFVKGFTRSEERSVGKECVSTCRSRWSPYH